MFLTSEIPSTASLKVDINDFQFFKITSYQNVTKMRHIQHFIILPFSRDESHLTNNVVETVGRTS